MALSSMTGFATASGTGDGLHWTWEIKSVNGKVLDMRFRLPTGFEALEAPARTVLAQHLKRGNLQVNFSLTGHVASQKMVVNEAALEQVLVIAERLRDRVGGMPLSAEALLGLRGVVETEDASPADLLETLGAAVLATLGQAAQALQRARAEEGERLSAVIAAQVDRIAALTQAARANPARSVEAIKARLAEQVSRLLEASSSLDHDRLHQEAILLATRADIQEEIDRLEGHIEAARVLLASTEPAGRKFDFLAQEFNREANTLCSKSIDKSLTNTGLDLKTTIDQMREQVQNIE
jgi:uncharacterized protein (TIGR00255 family)